MKDLREFISRAKELGELRIIEGAHWDLEIGAICYLAGKSNTPPALLFDKVQGYPAGYRILALPSCNDKRMALELGIDLESKGLELVRRLREKLRQPVKLVPPVEVKDGPILENVKSGKDVNLFQFPTPKWQEGDGGRYIGTGDNVIVKDPDEGWINVGVQRVQIHDETTATIFYERGRQGDIIRRKYWSKGKSCPVVVTCGGDPLYVTLCGQPVPWGTSEYDYVGWWKGEPIQVIKGPATGLPIPAYAEIALEGEMLPMDKDSRMEGPFSEWSGHFTPKRLESTFKVKNVLYRNDPIILADLPFLGPGVTPYPLTWLRAARIWNHLDALVPGVQGVYIPIEFGTSAALVISLSQKYPGHAKLAALSAMGYPQYMQRFVIVVDDDVDPSNLREVLFAIGLRAEPAEFEIVKGLWGGSLNPLLSPEKRAAQDFTHSGTIILACKPFHWMKDFPEAIKTAPDLEKKVERKWSKVVFPDGINR